MKKDILFCFILFLFINYFDFCFAELIEKHNEYIIDNIQNKDNKKTVYLTFDICNSREYFNIDMEIYNFLVENKINSTFFISGRFLTREENIEFIKQMAKYDFFSIQNHGLQHKPLALSNNRIYGIKSTKNKEEVYREVYDNEILLEKLTSIKPTWYRSGTAMYEIEALDIIKNDYKIAGFTITLDKGTTLTKKEIYKNRLRIKSGDIVLIHINHPEKQLSATIIDVIKYLKQNGFIFKKLD